MSLPLSTLPYLRIGWQKVCDRYNTTAYVTQLRGSAGVACYTNRSEPKPPELSLKPLPRHGPPTLETDCQSAS